MKMKIQEKEFLNELEVEAMGIRSACALRNDRCDRTNLIPYYKLGRKVVYRRSDILAFVEKCRRE